MVETQAEAVVVVSDEPDDSEVLLISFELEQMLGELRPGTRAPKVCRHRRNKTYSKYNNLII